MSTHGTVSATGELTANDLYRFTLTTLVRRMWWFMGIMIVTGIWFVFYSLKGLPDWEWNFQHLMAPVFSFVLFPYAFFVAPYLSAKKQIRTNPNLKGSLSYLFSTAGIEIAGPNSRSHLDWPAIVRVWETSDQFLFYPQSSVAHVIPKRFLSASEDQSTLRSLVRANVPDSKLRK